MLTLAAQIADANSRILKWEPSYTHAYPAAEESDHFLNGAGCWCMPNHVYNGDETILVHRRTRAD